MIFDRERISSISIGRLGGRLSGRRSGCLVGCLVLALVCGCSKDDPKAKGAAGPPPVAVDAAITSREDVPVTVRAIGTVEPSKTVSVRARIGGELTRVAVTQGQEVRAGQLLFKIDARPYLAALQATEAGLARDAARAASARAEVERTAELITKDYVTKQDFDNVRANAAALAATVAGDSAAVAAARLDVEYCTITAPIAGRIGDLLIHEGNLVKANDVPLLVINQLAPIQVGFSVPEQQLGLIRRYMAEGSLEVRAVSPSDSGLVAVGELKFVDNAVDETTGTILLKAVFANEDRALWPGQFVNVSLALTVRREVVVAPSAAVQTGQQGDFVYVIKPDMAVEMRPVKTGPSLDHRIVIESGLDAGERVVTDGQLRLTPGAKVSIKGARRRLAGSDPMNIAGIFIRRPVMTTLIMLGILLFGVMGYRSLPVSDLPNVDFPTIQVSANVPGASPEDMAAAVATPLEKQFSTIAGITSMTSTNGQGNTQVTLQFDLSRDIDAAAQDVQAAIAGTLSRLPRDMPSPPSYRKVNPADSPILFLAMTSATLPLYQLDEYAQTLLAQRISMVSGVAQVSVFGSQKYAVRVQLDPNALASMGIGIEEVTNSIRAANVNLPTGVLSGAEKSFAIQASGQLYDADAYRPVIVAYRNGHPVRLEEVGKVFDSVENNKVAAWFVDQRAIVLAVQKQPGTNTVAVAKAVQDLLPTFRGKLPASVTMNVLFDRSLSIHESVNDVKTTLLITLILVILVIFLFLRNISATIIPSLALPMSLVGTFTAMHLLGFSLDNLSLMALTLSVGFVVDDAIVMLENIVRHMEMGEKPLEAALNGSREIGFTILSMTLSLAAVFIPILFLGGIMGRLFHEFAVTIGLAILISGFVSLSLTPMLSSRWLRPSAQAHHGRFYAWSEHVFDSLLGAYERGLKWSIVHRRVVVIFSGVILALTFVMFRLAPKGFLPTEDTGQIRGSTEMAQGTAFDAMVAHQKEVAAVLAKDPDIAAFMSNVGGRGAAHRTRGTSSSG